MDRHSLSALLLVLLHSVTTLCGKEYTEAVYCPENQKAHHGSCYEFVTLQRSFIHAQAGCERGGGHLAFIHEKETQQFLQKHLQPGNNWWLGLASASLSSVSSKDPLSWLDGSEVRYSNWLGGDMPSAGCGYISKELNNQWEATSNCSQELFFICEFESRQSLACTDNNAMLKCASNEVIEIDKSFYGRNTVHYCRADHVLSPTSVQDTCSWVDVAGVVSDVCNGKQACEVPADMPAFGKPCPQLGSYLSIKYHCKAASNNYGSSSQLKRHYRNTNNCTCKDLHDSKSDDVKITCVSNCNTINVNLDLILKSDDKDVTIDGWYYMKSDGPYKISPCRKDGTGEIFLSQCLANSSTLYFPSIMLKTLTEDTYIVAKGKKSGALGYDCHKVEFMKPIVPSILSNIILPVPACNIYPTDGYTHTPFTIYCTISNDLCDKYRNLICTFEVKTSQGDSVYKGYQWAMSNLYLRQGDIKLNVTVTNNFGQTSNTSLTVHVKDSSAGAVSNAVSQALSLQKEGAISVSAFAEMIETMSNNLNSSLSDNDTNALLENMTMALCNAVSQNNTVNAQDQINMISSSLLSLVQHENHLTHTSKKGACCVLENLSKNQNAFLGGNKSVVNLTLPLISSISILLNLSADSDQEISEILISTMDNIATLILANKTINTEPVSISSSMVHLFVNKLTPDNLNNTEIITGNTASFSLPPSVYHLLPVNEPVNLRMMSFDKNPYAWNNETDITRTVASLSLSNDNGSVIPVENLSDEIEIYLPRLGGAVPKKRLLNLTSHSTMIINMTTSNITLVLKLEPSDNTPLMLHLGFQYYPNDTNYLAKTEFPQPQDSPALGYTWVLNPNDVALEVGVYYLLVRPIVPAGVNSSKTSVFVTSISAACKYWNETNSTWSDEGCRVGPRTTSLVTQCLCTHLTAFGNSFFVMPNTVDVSRTAELFSTFANNPVVVCFVGAIILAYFMAVIWAHRKDRQDKIKVKITVLEDNDPLAEYRYLVAVTTGHRHGSATTSHVTLMLTGSVWESRPHHLTDPDKVVFTRGGVDIFLLTTPFSLGDLQSIRLWHDNSGENPDWYVSKVMVQDLETGQIWHFLCNSWLAIDIGDCTLDKVFSLASDNDLKGFRNLFFTKTTKDLCDGHIWYSVLNRPAKSNFTRVQRLSCCFSLLLCTMLTSIMFWGVPKNPSEQDMDLGTIKFNIQQVMIGVQSSIIMFPVNLLIVTIFRITRPRKKKEVAIIQETKTGSPKQEKKLAERWRIQTDITIDIVVKEVKKIVRALAKAVRCPVPNAAEESEPSDISTLLFLLEDIIRKQNFTLASFFAEDSENDNVKVYKLYRHYLYKQLRNLEKELRLLGPSHFPKPDGYIQVMLHVRGIKQLLEPYLYSNPTGNEVHIAHPEAQKQKKCYQKGLPWWFVIIGWILVAASSGVSAYFTMMYGLTYGKERSISWLISISVSFFESLFVTQPIKVLGFAIFFALVVKNFENEDDDYFSLLKDMTLTYSEDPDDVRISRRDSTCSYYQPPPLSELEKMKENYVKNQKVIALFKEIIIYVAFLCVLLMATYGQRDPNAYYLTQHIQQKFGYGITESMSPGDVFVWANNVLISNLFGQRSGFITDGKSMLVGSARIRQIRVHRDSCKISKAMQHTVHDCHAPYSWAIEDMGSFGPGWNRSSDSNTTDSLLVPWQYQTASQLRSHPLWGTMAFYRGGGFVLDLGLDPQEASSMLEYLFHNTWLDVYTRAIFVEFTVYNANVNLFCIVTLMLETTAVGAFQYSSELHNLRLYQTTDGINIVACEVIYFLFILYYMFLQIKKIKQQKLQYFRSKHNLLELAIILLSLAAVGAIVNRTIQGNQDLKYFQEHNDQFPSFYDTASADASLGYILAFLILLGTVKMWHLMRLNSKLNLITCTLQRAWNDISSFIVVLIIMVLAYSIVSNLLFGWILYTYKTLQDSMIAIIALQLGVFNYGEILDLNPVLGAFLILSCVIFMTFVVLNLFISVILEAFSHEQKNYKPSEEEEVVDLMMTKICKMFGIPVKKK